MVNKHKPDFFFNLEKLSLTVAGHFFPCKSSLQLFVELLSKYASHAFLHNI